MAYLCYFAFTETNSPPKLDGMLGNLGTDQSKINSSILNDVSKLVIILKSLAHLFLARTVTDVLFLVLKLVLVYLYRFGKLVVLILYGPFFNGSNHKL